jgi:anthranilate synthase component 1
MIQPDFKTFSKLARQGNLVPVYETFTADLLTPVGAHLRLAHNAKYSFLLESVEGGENIARYTFAGANPQEVFRSRAEMQPRNGREAQNFRGQPHRVFAAAHRAV